MFRAHTDNPAVRQARPTQATLAALSQQQATFNVQAIEDSTVLELPFAHLEMLYEKVPKMERNFRIITQRAFVAFQNRIVQNLSMDAMDRYKLFSAKFPGIETRIPQKLVASYLGITPEFLSRLKKRMMEESKD